LPKGTQNAAKKGSEGKDITAGELAEKGKRIKESHLTEIQEKHERVKKQKTLFESENNTIEQE